MQEQNDWRESLSQGDGGCRWCRSPPLPPIQLPKAHLGDSAAAAEKASVLHFPFFIYGPLEASHTRLTAGTFLGDPPMDLITFEDIQLSSSKVTVLFGKW